MRESVPLKRLATVIAGQSPSGTDVVDLDTALPFLQGNAEFAAESPNARYSCPTAPKVAEAGDVLLSVRAPVGALNVADQAYGIGRGLCALRPMPATDHRFLWWTMHATRPLLSAFAVGSTYEAVTADVVAELPMPGPPLEEQRAIADYLDAETARIDALITKKRRLIDLLEERRAGTIEAAIRDLVLQHGPQPLKYAAGEILVGIVITPAAFYADAGVLALRGTNVKPGWFDLADVVHLSKAGDALHKKSRLTTGDLVVVRTGQAGAACVVPPELEGANCIDLLIIRRSAQVDPAFLEFVLNSDWTLKHIDAHSVGTIQSHFNVAALKELPVPVPTIEEQRKVAARLQRKVSVLDRSKFALTRQIELLAEHRQALITAAVTGEFQVPGVAA